MHDPERVHLRETERRLEDVIDRELGGEGAARVEFVPEVVPGEHLHDQIRHARLELAEVEDPDEVGALHPRGQARFAEEARTQDRIGRELRPHELDRDLLMDLRVTPGRDDAHPAGPEDPLDDVTPGDPLPDERPDEG